MGVFCLVLHTHLPYVRRNGVWPCGEDFFHQAATEAYLPVLGALRRLGERGLRDALTVGITPLVAHQMQDPHMLRELELYLGRYELRALRQVANYRGVYEREFRDLAAFYSLFARAQGDLLDALDGIASGFAALECAGVIEVLGGPATHPYLPLVREPALAAAQVRLGAREHRRHFGRAPRGMWLPECAYRPAAGIEDLLEANGVGHVVVDGPTMLRSAGPGSTFRPRRIGESGVVAFARNLGVTYRVWSPTGGYPTGKWYRDFYHYDLEGGFKNWRVTSIRKPVGSKRAYEPERAVAAARRDAEDFVALLGATLDAHERETGREGVVLAAYDTELFGHWWFEGPAWLERVFELLAESSNVRPLTLEAVLERFGDPEPADLVEGSWGFRKDHRSWVAEGTEEMWWFLGEIEAETVRLLEKFGDATGARAEALAQLVREALLLQSSDWPFMVIRGRNPDYARERFATHQQRWNRLADLLRSRARDETVARVTDEIREVDNILPNLDPDEVTG